MKRKTYAKYEKDIVITDVDGNVDVTFCYTAKSILHDFYTRQKKKDLESDNIALITVASKIVRSDIKCMIISKQSYPISIWSRINKFPHQVLADVFEIILG